MDDSLLDLLVCPITHRKLRREGDFLVTQPIEGVGEIRYPIRDGIPVLLPDAAILPEGLTMEELKSGVKT